MEKLNNFRKIMKTCDYQAFIVPSNDTHFSEYVADHWKSRQWISGFDGSAGTVVITDEKAHIWVDSRYYTQAEIQLKDSEFIIQKMNLANTPTINSWLNKNINNGGKVAIDASLISVNEFNNLQKDLKNLEVVAVGDPFEKIWTDRPSLPNKPITKLYEAITGETIKSKVKRISNELGLRDKIYITSVLDEIAWLLNIRGEDVEYNPVVISHAVVKDGSIDFFCNKEKISDDIEFVLNNSNVTVYQYDEFHQYLDKLSDKNVIINFSKFDINSYNRLKNSGANIIAEDIDCGIITKMKSIKNNTELEGMHNAMILDGIALVKFNMWLEGAVPNGEDIDEYLVGKKLLEFREQSEDFISESFAPIVGYKDNGAIVHYSAPEHGSKKIANSGFILIDSGGQYKTGTTDITRTLHFATPSDQEIQDYTNVLKGNMSLAMAVFPSGTCGFQLDILARQYLLKGSLNYGHGTGHGIGCRLNVHEGPHSIRMNYNPYPIEKGMLTSNEPGIYRVGKYGIRLENIIECVKHSKNEFGEFLKFKTITLFPFESKCIDVGMLTVEERQRLNKYHRTVFEKLSEYLNTDEKLWLSNKTKEI